jgi:hypothetical protein
MSVARVVAIAALLIASCVVAWRAARLAEVRSAASDSDTALATARGAAAEIDRLAALPPTALPPGTTDAELLRAVQEALAAAGVASGAIRDLSIDARSDERAGPGNTGLSRRSGRVNLAGVTLPQLGAALNALRARLPPLRVEQIAIQRENTAVDAPRYRVALSFAARTPIAASAGAPDENNKR